MWKVLEDREQLQHLIVNLNLLEIIEIMNLPLIPHRQNIKMEIIRKYSSLPSPARTTKHQGACLSQLIEDLSVVLGTGRGEYPAEGLLARW